MEQGGIANSCGFLSTIIRVRIISKTLFFVFGFEGRALKLCNFPFHKILNSYTKVFSLFWTLDLNLSTKFILVLDLSRTFFHDFQQFLGLIPILHILWIFYRANYFYSKKIMQELTSFLEKKKSHLANIMCSNSILI